MKENLTMSFNRFVSIPINLRFFKLDLDEVEKYIAERYEKEFNEPPLEVEALKYPGEIDITIGIPEITDAKREFSNMIEDELNNQGLSVLIILDDKSQEQKKFK